MKTRIKKIIIGYEPVWAVGSGNPCDLEEAQTMRLLIRKIIPKKYSLSLINKVKILYGGSVNSKNALGYIKEVDFVSCYLGREEFRLPERVHRIADRVK